MCNLLVNANWRPIFVFSVMREACVQVFAKLGGPGLGADLAAPTRLWIGSPDSRNHLYPQGPDCKSDRVSDFTSRCSWRPAHVQ
eukprot:2686727-Pyramimonas_sp.AAC.1